MPNFVDQVRVSLQAGDGGNGCASIRREKYKPLAGANGGNGGNGGSIYLVANKGVTSLLDYHFLPKKVAPNGSMGLGGDKDGKRGEHVKLQVPLGTVVKTLSGEVVVDLVDDGQEFLCCQGGVGGLGNAALASRYRKAPGFALNGTSGEVAELCLELKLLADVALVGFPSAGKSSLIAAISAARPKVADYPFTTLVPNLGIVSSYNHRFTVADVPGLIPGAANGKGLGLEFLRHIERTSVIVHIIDMNTYESGRDPISDFNQIVQELDSYDVNYNYENSPINSRLRLVVLNKIDDSLARDLAELAREEFLKMGEQVHLISATTHEGLPELVQEISRLVKQAQQTAVRNVSNVDDMNTRTIIELKPQTHSRSSQSANSRDVNRCRNEFSITRQEAVLTNRGEVDQNTIHYWYEVVGEKLRRWVLQTDFSNDEAVGYLADRLAKIGLEDELVKMGAVEHDEVRISIKNTRANYLISEQEWYIFTFEPTLSAGAEVLYSSRMGQDSRLEYENRVRRATRREKRELNF